MQFLAHVANELGQARLDVHMHIFARYRPDKATGFNLGKNVLQTLLDRGIFICGEYASSCQHIGMSTGAGNVINSEPPVECFRRSETLHKSIGRLAKAAAPQLLTVLFISIAHDVPSS